MDDQRVLIIETDGALRRMLVGTIRMRGYPYLLASSADEALVALGENNFFTVVDLGLSWDEHDFSENGLHVSYAPRRAWSSPWGLSRSSRCRGFSVRARAERVMAVYGDLIRDGRGATAWAARGPGRDGAGR